MLSRNYWEWKRRAERLSKIASTPRPKRAAAPTTRLDLNQVQRMREAVTSGDDRLLDINEAAEMLSVGVDYLYQHWQTLPFAMKLSPKVVRFSLRGIQAYLAIMLEQRQEELFGRGEDKV